MRTLLAVLLLTGSLVASAPAHSETLVAVGTEDGKPAADGGYESTPLMLHLVTDGASAGSWTRSPLPQPRGGDLGPPVLLGATFSTVSTAWAFGGTESGPILFRSDDAGSTWIDATDALPDAMKFHRVRALSFATEKEGWLVSTTPAGIGPYVWKTSDGGASWEGLPALTLTIGNTFALGRADRAVQLLQSDADGTTIRTLDGALSEPPMVPPSGGFHGAAFAVSRTRTWIVGNQDSSDTGGSVAIYANGSGQPWIQQKTDAVLAELRTVDFANETSGLACGNTLIHDPPRPVCLYTSDGVRWNESTMPDGLDGMVMIAVVSTSNATGYGVTQVLGIPGLAFLETADGGKTWKRLIAEFDGTAHVRGLARSSASPQ